MARYNTIYAGPVSNPTPHAMEALTSVALTPGSLVTFDAANGFTPATAATTAARIGVTTASTPSRTARVVTVAPTSRNAAITDRSTATVIGAITRPTVGNRPPSTR